MKSFIIENNTFKFPKSLSVLKKIPVYATSSSTQDVILEYAARINNVKDCSIDYTMIDAPYNWYESIDFRAFDGIKLTVFKHNTNQIIQEKVLLNRNSVSKTTVYKKNIGNFNFDKNVDVQVDVQLNSGYMRALTNKLDRDELPDLETYCALQCCCGGGPPPPPPTKYCSIFEALDVNISYNAEGIIDKDFYHFKSSKDIFEKGGKIYKITDEFEMPFTKNYSSLFLGINSNFCSDFSHRDQEVFFNYKLDNKEEEYFTCSRIHSVGNIAECKNNIIEDNTDGELFEVPSELSETTEQNMQDSQIYFKVDITELINGITDIHSKSLMRFEETDVMEFLNFNIKLRKNEKSLFVILEYLAKLDDIDGFENDKLRFKSKTDIGCLLTI